MSSLINRQEKIKPNLKNKSKIKIGKQKKVKTNSKIKNEKKMDNYSEMFQVIVGNNNIKPEKEENSKVNTRAKRVFRRNTKLVTEENSKINTRAKRIFRRNTKIYIFGELALLNQNQINSLFKIFYSCFMNLDITNETYFGFLSKRNKTIGGFCYLNTETKSFRDKVGINTFPNSLFIYNFCINSKYRRRGYAIKLMKKFEKYSKNILKKDYMYLFVESKNKAAIKLYCKCKYIVDLMSDNIIVMKKKL